MSPYRVNCYRAPVPLEDRTWVKVTLFLLSLAFTFTAGPVALWLLDAGLAP